MKNNVISISEKMCEVSEKRGPKAHYDAVWEANERTPAQANVYMHLDNMLATYGEAFTLTVIGQYLSAMEDSNDKSA